MNGVIEESSSSVELTDFITRVTLTPGTPSGGEYTVKCNLSLDYAAAIMGARDMYSGKVTLLSSFFWNYRNSHSSVVPLSRVVSIVNGLYINQKSVS